jgi:hypothetical protein
MLVSTAEHTIRLNAWGTKRELAYTLGSCDAGSILLGDDIEEAREFYSAVVYSEWPKTSAGCFGIGICSGGHGVVPHLLLRGNTPVLAFGFNSEAVAINIEQRSKCSSIGLDSMFISFIHVRDEKIVLILHEIGVVAMNEDCQELWRYCRDVIVDFRIEPGRLALNFMDCAPVNLELANGRVID